MNKYIYTAIFLFSCLYLLIFLGGFLNNSERFMVNQVGPYSLVRISKPYY